MAPTSRTMLTQNGLASKRDDLVVVGTYDDYTDAQAAVDRLSDGGFPVERLRIVGEGLTFVEDVTGRRDMRKAAGEGARYGSITAGLIGLLFGLLDWYEPLVSGAQLALYGIVVGGLFGALTGLIVHKSTGGKRDFASEPSMTADHFQVLSDSEVANDARTRLATPATQTAAGS